MACTVRRPMPGQEKMVSVTMVPARRVAKGVPKKNRACGEPLGPRRADVVARQLFDHRAAHHARENRGKRGAERNGGQDEVEQASRPETGSQPNSIEKIRIST